MFAALSRARGLAFYQTNYACSPLIVIGSPTDKYDVDIEQLVAFDPDDILTDLNKVKLKDSLLECTEQGRAMVLVGATERVTARTILDYISGLLAGWYHFSSVIELAL